LFAHGAQHTHGTLTAVNLTFAALIVTLAPESREHFDGIHAYRRGFPTRDCE